MAPRDLFADSGTGAEAKTHPWGFDWPTVGRILGLDARSAIQGVASIPATLMDIPAEGFNLGADALLGKGKGLDGNDGGFRYNEMNQNVGDILTKLGLPQPETAGERVGSTIAGAVAGTGGAIKAAKGLTGAANPVTAKVAQQVASHPGMQLTAATTGGASAAGAREAGLPWYAQEVAGLVGGMAPFGVPSMYRAGASGANRLVSGLSEGRVQLLDPTTEAERRIRAAFLQDGGPETAARNAASYANSGASTPSLMDIGGGNVRRLVRAAAGPGDETHNIATAYADQVRANLQDNAANAARQLAPGETRTVPQAETQFEGDQDRLATEQYREPYAQPAAVTKDMVSALQGPEGRGAINAAYATARARRDLPLMGELSDLREVAAEQSGGQDIVTGQRQSMEQALSGLSARALDRVRIAMREQAQALAANGKRGMAGGYYDRVRDIDTALDQTPGLTDARASYRQMQQQRDAIPLGQSILNMPSDQYAAEISGLAGVGGPPNIGAGLRVGARQSILDSIERPAAGQTGVLNRLSTGSGPGRNLAATFGDQRTAQFRAAIGNEVRRLRNANFISPETGSQTQLRLADEALMGGVPTSVGGFVTNIADKIMRKIQLTPAERSEIVKLGTSEADLRRFISSLPARTPTSATLAAPLSTVITTGRN